MLVCSAMMLLFLIYETYVKGSKIGGCLKRNSAHIREAKVKKKKMQMKQFVEFLCLITITPLKWFLVCPLMRQNPNVWT